MWLVFYKKDTGRPGVPYEATVEEALCFGWIYSIIKKLDQRRYARKFTPRTSGSAWSQLNKARAERMIRDGRMTAAGLRMIEEAKSSGEWARLRSPPRIPADKIPGEFSKALTGHPAVTKTFLALAPSYRKHYVIWIASAKKPETRSRRTVEAIRKLERGERLGLK